MCSGQDRDHAGECCPQFAGRVRGFLQPWILFQLSRGSAHGYELLERLSEGQDLANADPGLLYRTLRGFEEEGLVRSSWDTAGSGPARRVYVITDLGREHLRGWVVHLRRVRGQLDHFLSNYEALMTVKGGERDARTP